MAALAAAIGLLPASIATGIGSETQQPLARVVVGGMITSAVLILLVLPAMYFLVHRYAEQRSMVSRSVLGSAQGETVLGD
jgi:cobalt-zinc-cadmium resistance protein CzcA